MKRPSALSSEELNRRLSELPGWSIVQNKLHKSFVFSDFVRAFGFMTQVALEAEKLNHHPEWSNVYNRVAVNLITHEVAGHSGAALTELDLALALKMDELALSVNN